MLTYKHGCKAGTGASLEVTITDEWDNDCKVTLKLYRQTNDEKTMGANGSRWDFDDPRPAIVDLNAQRASRIIAVMRGLSDSVSPNNDGMTISDRDSTAVVFFDHVTDPNGYNLHIKQGWANGESTNVRILLNPNEALSLRLALENVMGRLAFGKNK